MNPTSGENQGRMEDEARSQRRSGGASSSGTAENGRPPLFLVRNKDSVRFLHMDDIDWMRAEGNYTCVRAGKVEYLARRGIGQMDAQLEQGRFLRISRSIIVNLDRVERLVPWFSGGYKVRLRTGAEFKLTKKYAHELFALVGKPL